MIICSGDVHPHRHPAPSRTFEDILEPAKALMMYGIEISPDTRPRHLRVVISAMMIWVKSCKPVYPLAHEYQ